MVSKMTVLKNPTGLHARPATDLIAFAKKFDCTTFLVNGSKKANAASIINLLTLGAKEGTELEVICEGPAENEAAPQIAAYIANIME